METSTGIIANTNKFDNSTQRTMGCAAKLFQDNKRTMLMASGVYLGFWLLIGLLLGINGISTSGAWTAMFFVAASICSTFIASSTFSDMRHKEGRLSLLMQPASTAEKFSPRYIFAMVIAPLVTLLGCISLDLGNWIGGLLIGENNHYFDTFGRIVQEFSSKGVIVSILTVFVNQSFFMFGAILWPRHAFLKTAALSIALFSIFTSMFAYFVTHSGWIIYNTDIDMGFPFIVTVQILIILFFSFLSYNRLKRSTIIYGLKQ